MEPSNNEQLTRRERRELERQREREDPGHKEKQETRKKIIRRVLIGATAIAIIGGITWLVTLPPRSEAPRPGESFQIQGQTHIAVGATHAAYSSNPPSSGPHYAQPATWGVHDTELPDEQVIHNLEHGGIWISYKGIDASSTAALEKITNSQSKIIMEPRANNDAPIILVSWGKVQKFEAYDEQGINTFIEANKNQSPEPLAQ